MAFAPVFQRPFSATFDRRAAAAGNGLLNALIAYWPGNEASGNLLDAHTNGLHLTDTNTVTNAAGKVYATARQYTAANFESHTRAGYDALLSAGDVDFTIAAWMYLDILTATAYGPAKWVVAAGAREYALTYVTGTNRWRWLVSSDGTANTALLANNAGAVSSGVWYFVVGWHDAGNDQIGIQINNGTPDTATYATGVANTVTPFSVSTNAGFFTGRIGPVAFWKSAAGGGGVLSSSQRNALWNGGAGLAYVAFTT